MAYMLVHSNILNPVLCHLLIPKNRPPSKLFMFSLGKIWQRNRVTICLLCQLLSKVLQWQVVKYCLIESVRFDQEKVFMGF